MTGLCAYQIWCTGSSVHSTPRSGICKVAFWKTGAGHSRNHQ